MSGVIFTQKWRKMERQKVIIDVEITGLDPERVEIENKQKLITSLNHCLTK